MFLRSLQRARNLTKSKAKSSKSNSNQVSTEGKPCTLLSPERKKPERTTFDHDELSNFMSVNDFTYLIRSHSFCKKGFTIDHNHKCLTIFSCYNFDGHNNQASVALIDGSDCSIRFIRYEGS